MSYTYIHIHTLIRQLPVPLLATSIVHSKLDYCNSLYYKLPNSQLSRLQQIQHVTSPPVSFTYFRLHPAHDHPCRRPTRRALSNSCLVAVCLWLAIAKAVSRCPGRLKLLMQPRCVVQTRILAASSSFSHLSVAGSGETWRVTDFTRAPHPLVFVYRFTSVSHDLQRRSA